MHHPGKGRIPHVAKDSYEFCRMMPEKTWVEWQGGAILILKTPDRELYMPMFLSDTGFMPDDLKDHTEGALYNVWYIFSKKGRPVDIVHAVMEPSGCTMHFTKEQHGSELTRSLSQVPLIWFTLMHRTIKAERAALEGREPEPTEDLCGAKLKTFSARVGDTFSYQRVKSLVSRPELAHEGASRSETGTGPRKKDHAVRGFWRQPRRKTCRMSTGHLWVTNEEHTQQTCAWCGHKRTWVAEHRRGDKELGTVTRVIT